MRFVPTYSEVMTLAFLGTLFLYLRALASSSRLKGVLRTALRAADAYKPGGRDEVRIKYNQLAQLMGWRSENYPMRDPGSFGGKPSERHPASESASKRQKRGR